MSEQEQAIIKSFDSLSLQTIIDAIPIAVMIIGPGGAYIDCNKATLSIFGARNKGDIIGKTPADLSPRFQENGSDSDMLSRKYIQEAETHDGATFFFDHKTMAGTLFHTKVTICKIIYEEDPCLMVTVDDMKGLVREEENTMLVQYNPYGLLNLSSDLTITAVNKAFSKISGCRPEEWIGRSFKEFDVVRREGPTVDDALRDKKTVSGKVDVRFPNGIKKMEYSFLPVYGSDGDLIRVFEVFADLTEQLDTIAYYESILDAVPYPIHVTDLDMNWTYMNNTFEAILKNNRVIRDRKSSYGMPCKTANASICGTSNCGIHQLCTTGKNETYFEWLGASNKQTTAPVLNANGEKVGYVETVQDLTQQIKLIEYLKAEVERISGNLVLLNSGEFNLNMTMTASDKNSEDVKGMFEEINESFATLLTTLTNLIRDADDLAREALNGNLEARADLSRQKGNFVKIVDGFNRTLDSVIVPVNEALRVSKSYAEYDFTDRFSESMDVKGDWIHFKKSLDNIGIRVSEAVSLINKNITELAASAEETNASIEEVLAGAHQITASTSKVSQNAEQGGDGISQVLQAMEDLNLTVGAVSRKADSVSVSSNEANEFAKDGIVLAKQSERAMGDITSSAGDVERIVTDINVQMDEIGKIVRLISDIANQTNLLALNAAIEAARAGEAGRGFAVVAAEVKSLAQDSRKSAENIADMISALQNKANQATEAMKKSTNSVHEGSEALVKTLAAFDQIAVTIENINHNVVEVASASEEQAASVEEVTASIQEVANLVQNTSHEAGDAAAATQEATASIDEIGRIMSGVVGIVDSVTKEMSKFRVVR